jgi:hypothetical protein
VPLYMDVHTIEGGVSAGDVAEAHMKDLQEQAKHGVNYKSYWVDEREGKISASWRLQTRTQLTPSTGRRTDLSPRRFTRSRRASSGLPARGPARALVCSTGLFSWSPNQRFSRRAAGGN